MHYLIKRKENYIINPDLHFYLKVLLNDLDGGMPFWPDFITPQGEMMKLVSGKVIKDYVNSD